MFTKSIPWRDVNLVAKTVSVQFCWSFLRIFKTGHLLVVDYFLFLCEFNIFLSYCKLALCALCGRYVDLYVCSLHVEIFNDRYSVVHLQYPCLSPSPLHFSIVSHRLTFPCHLRALSHSLLTFCNQQGLTFFLLWAYSPLLRHLPPLFCQGRGN